MDAPAFDPLLAKRMLDLAGRHALRAAGRVEPNPMVGCVLVKEGQVIGIGHHRVFGGIHAERDALRSAARQGEDPKGAIAFVTLEPCNGVGKQPPCSHALVEAGIARVIYAASDPNVQKAGGAAYLETKGIPCTLVESSTLANGLSAPFRKRMATGLPWVIAKWAQTIDGRIATRTGESKWISNERSRARVHAIRSRVDAVVTGIGTIIADDPLLTTRIGRTPRRVARRVIADTDLDIPLSAQVVTTAREWPTTVVCAKDIAASDIMRAKREALETAGVEVIGVPGSVRGGVELPSLLRELVLRHIATNVMIEAGPGLLGAFFSEDLIDEAVVFVAPMLLGDELARAVAVGRIAERLTNARRMNLIRVKALNGDVELTYRRREQDVPRNTEA